MHKILESVISTGGYKLAEIQHKIKKMYLLGDLTEEQMDELLSKAAGGVSPDAERPEVMQMIHTLAEKISTLDARVKILEGKPDEPDVPEGDYPAWEPWDGISDDYQHGAIVAHKGKVWISTFLGQNVWEPGTVDEQFWKEYNPKES